MIATFVLGLYQQHQEEFLSKKEIRKIAPIVIFAITFIEILHKRANLKPNNEFKSLKIISFTFCALFWTKYLIIILEIFQECKYYHLA